MQKAVFSKALPEIYFLHIREKMQHLLSQFIQINVYKIYARQILGMMLALFIVL